MSPTIVVSEVASSVINSRHISELLLEEIKKTKSRSVLLDFSGVDFVSRSAAHSLLMVQDELKMKVSIKFLNAQPNVASIFSVVKSTIKDDPSLKSHLPNRVVNVAVEDAIFG